MTWIMELFYCRLTPTYTVGIVKLQFYNELGFISYYWCLFVQDVNLEWAIECR